MMISFRFLFLSSKRAEAPSAQSETAPKTSREPATPHLPCVIAWNRKGAERALAALMALGSVAQASQDQPAEAQVVDGEEEVEVEEEVEEVEEVELSPLSSLSLCFTFFSPVSALPTGSAAKPLPSSFHPWIEKWVRLLREAAIRRGRVVDGNDRSLIDDADAASHRTARGSPSGLRSAFNAPSLPQRRKR